MAWHGVAWQRFRRDLRQLTDSVSMIIIREGLPAVTSWGLHTQPGWRPPRWAVRPIEPDRFPRARPVMTFAPYMGDGHWGRVPSVHAFRMCYPALAWPINLQAYAMPSVPVPPTTSLTDMVTRSRLLAAHGLASCPSVRTQPLTATGAPSQTSTVRARMEC